MPKAVRVQRPSPWRRVRHLCIAGASEAYDSHTVPRAPHAYCISSAQSQMASPLSLNASAHLPPPFSVLSPKTVPGNSGPTLFGPRLYLVTPTDLQREQERTLTGTLFASWSWNLLYFKAWQLAVGGWRRLVVGGWRLAVGGGWRRLVAGGWWRLTIGGWRLVGVLGWRLVAVGGDWWRLAVGIRRLVVTGAVLKSCP